MRTTAEIPMRFSMLLSNKAGATWPVAASIVVLASLCAIAGLFVGSNPVKILDRRFQVIAVTASRGANQRVYVEHQLMGRLKDILTRVGLKVRPPRKVTISSRDTNCVCLSVVCAGEFAPREFQMIAADLVDSAGNVTRLDDCVYVPNKSENKHAFVWMQKLPPSRDISYSLRLKLPLQDKVLAEISLGKLL